MSQTASLETRTSEAATCDFEDVLHFWFPDEEPVGHETMARRMEWWFGGGTDAATLPLVIEGLQVGHYTASSCICAGCSDSVHR